MVPKLHAYGVVTALPKTFRMSTPFQGKLWCSEVMRPANVAAEHSLPKVKFEVREEKGA